MLNFSRVFPVPAYGTMKRLFFPLLALLLTVLACGRSAIQPTSTPFTQTPTITANPADLWYLRRGQAKSDQAWGVDVDSAGNIYTIGYYQSPPTALFYDMVIYKFAPDGRRNLAYSMGWQTGRKGIRRVCGRTHRLCWRNPTYFRCPGSGRYGGPGIGHAYR